MLGEKKSKMLQTYKISPLKIPQVTIQVTCKKHNLNMIHTQIKY